MGAESFYVNGFQGGSRATGFAGTAASATLTTDDGIGVATVVYHFYAVLWAGIGTGRTCLSLSGLTIFAHPNGMAYLDALLGLGRNGLQGPRGACIVAQTA